MLLRMLQDHAVVAALTAILGALVSHILWLRKWHLEKQHHASQLTDERARQDRLRFLNDLSKDYATLILAINEVDLLAHSNQTKVDAVEIHRKDAIKALANINMVAPQSIVNAANSSWEVATLIFNHDQTCPPDFLELLLRAYLVDFLSLAKLHLAGAENVTLEPDASQADFFQQTVEGFFKDLPKVFEERD